jgi:ferredoxin-fold anticodon binding domain-containing protein
MQGKFVIVRTYSAGVHVGTLEKRDGKEVTLTNSRRIWSWKGANTLHEIANNGVCNGSRVSETVPTVLLTEAIEVLGASEASKANLMAAGWSK